MTSKGRILQAVKNWRRLGNVASSLRCSCFPDYYHHGYNLLNWMMVKTWERSYTLHTLMSPFPSLHTHTHTHTHTQTSDLQQARETTNSQSQQSRSLEADLSQAEEAAMELQSQLTSTQQELQEALKLCGEHEVLIEERNTELDSLETQVR